MDLLSSREGFDESGKSQVAAVSILAARDGMKVREPDCQTGRHPPEKATCIRFLCMPECV